MKVALVVTTALAALSLIGCAAGPERNSELDAMSRGPALAVAHVKKHCHANAVWREVGMMLPHADGQKRPAVGIMCLSPQDMLVLLVCDKTGTYCNVLPYERNFDILAKEEELRRLEGRLIEKRRL